jgi:pyruvate/2-oxoacid:ferredoxin oxidoreductase beta subunit
MARRAVRNRVFPLLEVIDGVDWSLTVDEPAEPVTEYVRAQGRFRHINDAGLTRIQQDVDARWELLQELVRKRPSR